MDAIGARRAKHATASKIEVSCAYRAQHGNNTHRQRTHGQTKLRAIAEQQPKRALKRKPLVAVAITAVRIAS